MNYLIKCELQEAKNKAEIEEERQKYLRKVFIDQCINQRLDDIMKENRHA